MFRLYCVIFGLMFSAMTVFQLIMDFTSQKSSKEITFTHVEETWLSINSQIFYNSERYFKSEFSASNYRLFQDYFLDIPTFVPLAIFSFIFLVLISVSSKNKSY